jgi:hypothetical protein
MTTLIVHCDKCDREIDRDRTLLRIEAGPRRNNYPSSIDLCNDCSYNFLNWLADRPSATTASGLAASPGRN